MATRQLGTTQDANDLGVEGWRFTDTALLIENGVDLDAWGSRAHMIGVMNRASPFWCGDWINYGENRFGEKYAQFVEETGLDPATLTNRAWVSGQVTPERRQGPPLTWSHHEVVAPCTPEQQVALLERALKGEDGKPWTIAASRNPSNWTWTNFRCRKLKLTWLNRHPMTRYLPRLAATR